MSLPAALRRCADSRTLPWLAFLLGALISSQLLHRIEGKGIDFALYYFGGKVERHGSYTDTPAVLKLAEEANRLVPPDGVYGSPSLVGLVFQPLSLISINTAEIAFQALGLIALIFGVRCAAGGKWWPAWAGLALACRSSMSAVSLGNFSIYTTALLLFAYGSFRTQRNKHGGIALAMAIACKLYPAFLLLPLALKRQYQALKWTIFTTLGVLAITPFALGWNDTASAVRQVIDISSFVHPWSDNQGLPGTVRRLTYSQTWAEWTTRIAMATSVFILWRMRKHDATHLFALAILLMCLSQGISWNMYFGVTLVALLSLRDLNARRMTWAIMLASFIITNGNSGTEAGEFAFMPRGYIQTIGLIVMTATLISAIRKHGREKRLSPSKISGSHS